MHSINLPGWVLSLGGAAVLLASGCATKIEDYKDTTPVFAMEEYFSGPLIARGMIQNHAGKLTRNFCVEAMGSWQGHGDDRKGTLKETFYFNDGEITHRTWLLIPDPEQGLRAYHATAGDVIGVGSAREVGRAFNMRYVLSLPVKNKDGETKVYELKVNDWMYRLDDQRVVNRSTLSKWGIDVAAVTLFFEKGNGKCERPEAAK
ncbi:Uncharacterised protein [BD1-7 clade bacterium]|uniref:Lipoprotein n=1 Tax=BD1-7 clade bacterium TaxID=2029982 RepID=A0A5S9NZ28_9GAMM|nr:Uncharacterised protein [BD1-7 clade bacterium]CAA0096080.1 Uncharacterised protein [BD1-7 clade bacterium]